MKLKSFVIVGAAALLLGSVVAYRSYAGAKAMKAMMSAVPPPATVSTSPVGEQAWRETLSAVASLQGIQGIVVSAEVAGTVRTLRFESGAQVSKGDLLVEMDTSTEEAQLEGLKAAAKLAELNLNRHRELRERGSNTQLDLDTADAALAQASAQVLQLQANIAKKRLVAPFSGRLGIRLVSLGQYAAAGTPFVELENSEIIFADFSLPQQELPHVLPGMEVSVALDSYPGRVFKGTIQAASSRVAESTRSVRFRAALPNADGALRAGMFAKVAVEVGEAVPRAVIPGSCVVYSPYGDFVYVVATDAAGASVVRQQFVTLGVKRGDFVAVLKGLRPGELVVSAGQMKLRNGAPVRVNNSLPLAPSEQPRPVES